MIFCTRCNLWPQTLVFTVKSERKLDNTDLDAIWKKCLQGDRKAQFQLYNALSAKMLGLCMRYAGDAAEAEDILQNGFVKVFTKAERFENRGSLEGWIRRIMVNTAIERHRSTIKNGSEPLSEEYPVAADDGMEADAGLRYNDLLSLVRTLPSGYRTVFNLYAVEGYSHREIAEMLGISEAGSKSQLSRARRWLKEKLLNMENATR